MNSSKNSGQSRSRDKFAIKKSYPQIPYHHQERTFDSMENQLYPSRKPSAKSYIEPDHTPQVQRKSSQINSLHQQYNTLKEQMKKFPNRTPNSPQDIFSREKERSQGGFIEDEHQRQPRSQSSQQDENYHKNFRTSGRRDMYSYSQLPKTNYYLDQEYSMHQNKRRHQGQNEAHSNVERQPKHHDSSVSSANVYLNKVKSSAHSAYPSQNHHRNIRQRQGKRMSPVKIYQDDIDSPEKSSPKVTRGTLDKFYPIKTKLERFQMSIGQNMDALLDKLEELQKKHLSLDLYFEELRQSISYKKAQSNQSHEISYAKHRQYKFLISQLENKVQNLKSNNEKLQKQLVSMRINEGQFKSQIAQQQRRIKQSQILAQNIEKIKEIKANSERKVIEAQSRVVQLQREKSMVEEQLQRLKKEMEMEKSMVKEQHNVSHLISSSTLFGSFEDAQYLKQQVSRLQYENKEYQKLLTAKSSQISNLTKANTESKMMMDKLKEINEQLQRQSAKLQRDIVEKQLEATEKICSLNNSIKKKVKQYDNFKDLIVECLDQIYKKIPKKIRKNYDTDILNKNRTNKCETMFKGLSSFISYYQEQNSIVSTCFLKEFSISQLEIQKIGIQECFKKIKGESTESLKMITSLKQQNKTLQTENASLKQEVMVKSQSINAMARQQEEDNIITKKLRLQSLKKEVPTNDVEPRQSLGNLHEITKKKAQVDKLNKENNRLIEQSHQKYLLYQEQIAQLEIKQKQLKSKIQQMETDRSDLVSRLEERQGHIKSMEKIVSDLKVQKQGLSLKIAQITNEHKRVSIENQNKINKLSNENEAFKKKLSKLKGDQRQIQKIQQELRRKEQQIAVSTFELNEKQVKIRSINEEYRKILEELNTIRQQRQKEQQQRSKDQAMSISIEEKQEIIKRLTQQRNQTKDQYEKAKKIADQYKRIIEQHKREKADTQKKVQAEKEKKQKEIKKLTKQLQSKQEEIATLQKQRNEEALKSKDLQQKLSKVKIQNQELIRLINKRQDEIQTKQQVFNEDKQAITALQKKQLILQKELLQRQQYFKKSEVLMEQLIKQNEQYKAQLSKKETEILGLIKQRQELNFRLSQQLDTKNEELQMMKLDHEHELTLLKEKLQAVEMNLATSREQLKLKNGLVQELKDSMNKEKKEATSTKQTREQFEAHLKQCRQTISNLNNKLDIMQEQLQETRVKLNDREEQMNAAKREKTKYYKILQEKMDYIDQLEEAVKIKCNQVDQMKEIQEQLQEAREIYQQNEEKHRNEIEQLQESIKQLQQKSIQQINSLKKELLIYKEQAEELRQQVQKEQRNYRSKCKEKQQMAKEVQKKEADLVNMIKKYEELKARKNEQRDQRSYEQVQKTSPQKRQPIQDRPKQQPRHTPSRLQQENIAQHQRVRALQKQLDQKLVILQSLNQKIEEMDSTIGDLQLKIHTLMTENAELRSQKPRRYDGQPIQGHALQKTLQQKIKELDGKQYQLQQIRQQNKKALRIQQNEFNSNLQSYRQQLSIVQKQLITCQQINIALTLKCQSLQRQNKQLIKNKQPPNNMILSPSLVHPEFPSIDLGLPDRHILKHILSQSWHKQHCEISSKVVNQVISVRFIKEEVVHHYEEDRGNACEESQQSWPSIDTREKL